MREFENSFSTGFLNDLSIAKGMLKKKCDDIIAAKRLNENQEFKEEF